MGPLDALLDYLKFEPTDNGETGRKMRAVGRLLEVARILAAEIEPERVVQTVLREAARVLQSELAILHHAENGSGHVVAAYRRSDETFHQGAEVGESGLANRVIETGEALNIADLPGDESFGQVAPICGVAIRDTLLIPLRASHGNELLGVLQLVNHKNGRYEEVDGHVARAFAEHVVVAIERTRLVETLREQEVIEASLEVARDIQRGFMPSDLLPVRGYETACWWRANEDIGGDYCDMIRLKDGRSGFVVADVSGHGVGSSLLMASLRAALNSLVLEHSEPEVLLNLLGKSFAHDLPEGHFITLILAVLNPKDHSVEYANAGHGPSFYVEAATGDFIDLVSTGMPLGVQTTSYPQGWPIELERGDLLVLCTDGIVEAMDRQGRQFGVKRLKQLISQHAQRPLKEMVQRIADDVESHHRRHTPDDDQTILALRRS